MKLRQKWKLEVDLLEWPDFKRNTVVVKRL